MPLNRLQLVKAFEPTGTAHRESGPSGWCRSRKEIGELGVDVAPSAAAADRPSQNHPSLITRDVAGGAVGLTVVVGEDSFPDGGPAIPVSPLQLFDRVIPDVEGPRLDLPLLGKVRIDLVVTLVLGRSQGRDQCR